ncbi:MAG TPA: DNRLRE domain-containing protein [Solirubrobacteraceae bacterium]
MSSTLERRARVLAGRRLLFARIAACLLCALCIGATSAGVASAATGQQEAPGVEVEGPEGPEVPGEAEASPTFAERQQPDQPVTVLHELPELRGENSDTYLLSNGAYSQRLQNHPINFRAGDGSWQPIEDQLVQQADGSWSPQASPVPISLPASLGSGAVSVGTGARALSFQLEGAAQSEGAAAGSQRIYRSSLPRTDVTYAATAQAVRETLTLSSADAPTSYRYKLSLAEGLHASMQDGGSVLIENGAGETIYTLTPPRASDANPNRPFPSSDAVHLELSADGTVLTLVLDQAWLKDPGRVFPVTIDPEVWFGVSRDCPIISSGFANKEECGSHLYVGPDTPTPSEGIARSLLYFDTSSVPKGSVIVASYLRLHLSWDTTTSPIVVEAHALEKDFTNCVTWNRYDGINAWTTAGGDIKKTVVGERQVNHSEVGQDIRFGFTPQVEQWVRDPESNHGILLKAQNEAKAGYDSFAQSGNTESAPEPGLEVVYEPRLGIPPMGQVYQQGLANGSVMSVNVANGNLAISAPDVNYATEGYDTELGRSYNSLDDLLVGAAFGTWRLDKGDDPRLFRYSWDGTETFYSPDGGDTRFDRAQWADGHPAAGDKAFTGEAGFNEGLIQHEGGTRTLTFPSGVEWKFNENTWGEATEVIDPGGEGNTTSLTYASGYLTGAKDTHGHTLTLTREATNHDVTKIEGKKGEAWKYAYKEGRLVTVTNPAKEKAKYTYYKSGTASGLMESIDDESGTWVVVYDTQKRVSSLRKLVNGTVKKAGSKDEMTTLAYETEQTTVTNPGGGIGVYYYDQFGSQLEEPAAQEDASGFYAAYAGIEATAAKKALDLQDHAVVLDSQLSQQLGPNYTGEWFDPTSEKPLKLGLTSEGYEKTLEQDLDNLGLADNAESVAASASWSALEEAENSLTSSLHTLIEHNHLSLAISAQHDALIITKTNSLSSGESSELSSALASLSVPHLVKEVGESTLPGGLNNCLVGACSRPLRGGVRIRSAGIVNSCTAGFIATSIYDNKPYVMTAGHCFPGSGGVGQTWQAKYHEAGESEEHAQSYEWGLRNIGKAHSFVYAHEHEGITTTSEGDFGLIALSPTEFWGEFVVLQPIEPIVITYGGSELARNEHYTIIDNATATEQSPKSELVVCSGGVGQEHAVPESEEDCGVIVALNRTLTYQGKTERGLTEFDVCATGYSKHLEGGSSGSPVYKNHLAYGIHIGYTNSCTDAYEPISTAEHVLHVHVLHSIY